MKLILIANILFLLASVNTVVASSVQHEDDMQVISAADIVGVGTIASYKQTAHECLIQKTLHIKPEKLLAGSLQAGSPLAITYAWATQTDAKGNFLNKCPSVHHTLPPIAEAMDQGLRIIFSAKRDGSTLKVTGTYRLEKLQTIEDQIRSVSRQEITHERALGIAQEFVKEMGVAQLYKLATPLTRVFKDTFHFEFDRDGHAPISSRVLIIVNKKTGAANFVPQD